MSRRMGGNLHIAEKQVRAPLRRLNNHCGCEHSVLGGVVLLIAIKGTPD